MIEICKSDVVVHRSLVDSDDLHFTSENHRFDELGMLFQSRFLEQDFKVAVLFRVQPYHIAVYRRVCFRLPSRTFSCLSLLFSSIRIEIFCSVSSVMDFRLWRKSLPSLQASGKFVLSARIYFGCLKTQLAITAW